MLVPRSHWAEFLPGIPGWRPDPAAWLCCLGHAQAGQPLGDLLMASLLVYYGLHGSFTSSSTVEVLQAVEEPLP